MSENVVKPSSGKHRDVFALYEPLVHVSKQKGMVKNNIYAFAGEKGSLKTISSLCILYNWLTRYQAENYNAIFVTSERSAKAIIQQCIILGLDILPFTKSGTLVINDVRDTVEENPKKCITSVVEYVRKYKASMKLKYGDQAYTLCIIDSVTTFWNSKPAMSREYASELMNKIKPNIELGIVTMQLSEEGKSYGTGAEYYADVLIYLAKIYDNGDKRLMYISKDRCGPYISGAYEIDIPIPTDAISPITNIIFKKPFPIKGIYRSFFDALENVKYQNRYEKESQHNDNLAQLISKQTELLEQLVAEKESNNLYLHLLIEQLKSITEILKSQTDALVNLKQ